MKIFLPLLLALALSACGGNAAQKISELYDKGEAAAAKGLAEVLEVQCLRSDDRRKGFLDAINAEQVANGKTARAVAQDCNGDGQPDF